MSEVIVITSGKGGVGKTTTTANIGIGLSQLQKKVVVIDTDLGLRNLDVVMGLENRIVYNLVDVIEGGCRLKQALIKDKRFPELYLLPSAQTKDKTAVSPEQMKKLIEEHNLPPVVFHSLRHSSVTYKLKLNGGDIKAVQGDSGHSQVDMVTDVYSHIIDEDRRRNAELFEEAFYEKKNLDPKMREETTTQTVDVPDDVDAELLAKVLANPEMKALLASLAKAMK